MNRNYPFWCIKTKRYFIIETLKESTLWIELIQLICEKDQDKFSTRLIVFAKEVTHIFSLVYAAKNGKMKKLPAQKYKSLLFNWCCKNAEEMRFCLNSYEINEDAHKTFQTYEAIAALVSTILAQMSDDKVHCSEIALRTQHIIEKQRALRI